MFDFFKKSVPHTEEEQEPLSEFEQAAQYHCEVRGLDDRPVFLADVKNFDGDSFRLFPTLDADAPSVIYNSRYKLVFRTLHQPIPVWTGRVRGSTYKFRKMDELARLRDEQRASFRQRVSLATVVRNLLGLPENGETLTEAYYSRDYDQCEILDVGMGGLQLRSSHSFSKDDLLAVTGLRLYHDPSPSLCRSRSGGYPRETGLFAAAARSTLFRSRRSGGSAPPCSVFSEPVWAGYKITYRNQ